MQDAVDGAVQKAAVVGDDQRCVGIPRQVIFEPDGAFEVQIVGRFVQQQQIGRCKQNRCQGNAHTPAAGKFVARACLRMMIEPKARQDRRRAGFG